MNLPRWFVITVGLIALGLWIASFIATIFLPNYKTDPVIGWAMMVIVSACFTSGVIQGVARKMLRRREELEKTQKETEEIEQYDKRNA